MSAAGWVIMIGSVGGVTIFLLWCVAKVLGSTRTGDKVHGPLDIVPPDVQKEKND